MNSAKMNITYDFSGADGDAGVQFETVYSGYPEFLILYLKAYVLGNGFSFLSFFFFLVFYSFLSVVLTHKEKL